MRKIAMTTTAVLLLHLLALWAVQNGLLQKSLASSLPVLLVSLQTEPAKPPVTPPAPLPPARTPKPVAPLPASPPLRSEERPSALPSPTVGVSPTPAAAANTLTSSNGSPSPAPPPAAGALTGPSSPVASPAPPPAVELPSSDAQYLQNPKPDYPRASRQRGEQGRVVVNVLIGADGIAQKAEIKVSSGFERLDLAALNTVKAWRYVPGKRAGVPEPMWYAVPLNFVMD